MSQEFQITALQKRLVELERENSQLRQRLLFGSERSTVDVPDEFKSIFDQANKIVADYFSEAQFSPENGEIAISGERYILIRSASLSFEFQDIIREMYKDLGLPEATRISNNFLFDIGKVLGKKDSKAFHEKMGLTDPIEKLSAGPVHFAFTGWANVELLPESNPTPDDNYYLKFHHHNSFEAQAWKKAGRVSDIPVCIMNCGYSSGWCEESFGINLTTVEIACEARGDAHCTFVMAPTHLINEHLKQGQSSNGEQEYDVPIFFHRKVVEDQLLTSLQQKETLLKEVHHRVKNNLQIIASLFRLQLNGIEDSKTKEVFQTGVNRISAMAKIHELIYSDPNLSSIDIETYFKRILVSLLHVYQQPEKSIEIDFDFQVNEGKFNPDKAIPLGLILNEIASNAFIHAFADGGGVLSVKLKEEAQYFVLVISDNGPGLQEVKSNTGIGLSLIELLCEQIDADLVRECSKEGLRFEITFGK